MSEEEKKQEEQVFNQKLSSEDLEATVGGSMYCGETSYCGDSRISIGCSDANRRPMYGPDGNQFPFCAATVEEGSMCFTNDGCRHDAVIYNGMRSCDRAHR